MNDSLVEEVRRWIALDPDERDRAELQALLDANDESELERRFRVPLTFGTAGLRGPVMAGPAGMNRATVRRATVGVLAWLNEKGLDATRGVIVGRDARRGSEAFNDEVVSVLLGGGAVVYEMPSPLPTPLVPYCVKALGAVAGIMITASHNPREDNGYKLYAPDGAQIIPPDDEIVERYARAAGNVALADRSALRYRSVPPEVLDDYRSHMLARFRPEGGSDLAITYTPLHGVGGEFAMALLADAGYRRVAKVERQFAPDPLFPTLPFPNPEEPGALELSMETANAARSSLILANDPDADRLGAAVHDGIGWRVLRGDEIGWLLASWLVDEVKAKGQRMATSIVSSTLLAKLARESGVICATTLTGFKWIARAAGTGVLGFGYEEALGYAVDPAVSDKDGLSAALAVARVAHELARDGKTLIDRIDELEARFGVHRTAQLSFRAEGPTARDQIAQRIESLRSSTPDSLGGVRVTGVIDLADGWLGLPSTEGLVFELGELGRVIVRPSGTEAKVKAYLELTPPRDGTLEEQRDVSQRISNAIEADLTVRLDCD
ncbi:MAG TPA: phospho-sugar mutase [Acidimicrobiales bacterium]